MFILIVEKVKRKCNIKNDMTMKRLLTIIAFIFVGISFLSAHEVNEYKYLCLDIEENPYGIEKRLLEEFQKAGFIIIDNDFYEQLDPKEKAKTLFAEYDYFLNHNGDSSLTVFLKNASGATVWVKTGYGCTFLSASGDFKKCTKQIMDAFKSLKYKYDENITPDQTFQHPYAKWTEDSVKTYLKGRRISPVEGIYKNYSNDGNACSIGILKHNDKFYGIVLDSDNELWKKGDTKIILNHIEGSLYDVEYYDLNHRKLNAIAGIKDKRVLEFSAPYRGEVINFSFIKIFPSSGEKTVAGVSSNEQCKATGSGVLVSDNIIITNYHVVGDAEKVEAIININGIPETFLARVLCTDKTNDLAIVCVKDDKFKSVGDAPFRILPNNIDVGTSVFAMGFPLTTFLGDEVKITDGIISSKSGYEGDIVTYQISVPIQPGNSGGPLFDKNGNLVGITNAGIDKSVAENVGYAIKTPYVINIIESAPINIRIPQGKPLPKDNFPELIKSLKPYVVYLKIY